MPFPDTDRVQIPLDAFDAPRVQVFPVERLFAPIVNTQATFTVTELDATHVRVDFGQAMASNGPLSALSSYTISPALSIFAVAPQGIAQPTYVVLTTSEHQTGTLYTVSTPGVAAQGSPAPSATFVGHGIAPTLLRAVAVDARTVRLDYSEPVARLPAASIGNYTFVANGGSTPRTITVISPSVAGDPTSVFLTLSGDLSPGVGAYTVHALAAVTDSVGNAIDPANSTQNIDVSGTTHTLVSSDGGDIVALSLGLADGLYYVDLSLTPPTNLVRAYSGVAGSGVQARSLLGVLRFAMPRLPIATGYRVQTTAVVGGAIVTSGPILDVLARPRFSSTYLLRAALPASRWNVGPLRAEDDSL